MLMVIGVPREIKTEEYRAALTPDGARELCSRGHRVLCEPGLGAGSGFSDMEYSSTGAEMCLKERIFSESELILKVKEPLESEYGPLRPGQALFTYLHLAPNKPLTDALLSSGVVALAYETLTEGAGLPLLRPMSEIAGSMAPLMGAFYLQRQMGGRGVLPVSIPGAPAARTLILGAGVVGQSSLRVTHSLGGGVRVLNRGAEKLDLIKAHYGPSVTTGPLEEKTIEAHLPETDIVIGAVYSLGAAAPRLVTRRMLGLMQEGSVIVDVAIDQGGCIETSRPTTHADPVYVVDGIVHYAVANMPGAFPRTSTLALTSATLPYVLRLADMGVERAIREDAALRSALNVYEGRITHPGLAKSTGLPLGDIG